MCRRSETHDGSRLNAARRLKLAALVILLLAACSPAEQAGGQATPTLNPEQSFGKQVFEIHCESCHSTIPGSIIVGPSLAGVAQRAATRVDGMGGREYLEKSITKPSEYLVEGYPDLMPPALADTLSEEEVQAVVTYLLTLDE